MGGSFGICLFSLVLGQFLVGCEGLYCFNCNSVLHPRECAQVRTCGPHETCFSDRFVSASGYVYYRMGCRDRLQCITPAVGKRSGEVTLCSECCDGDLCHSRLCGSKDGNTTLGPICFHCSTKYPERCETVATCGRDEVCAISIGRQYCMSSQTCKQISLVAGRSLLSGHTCLNCCSTNLCNNNCTAGCEGLYCLNCNSVLHPRECTRVRKCGPHETCFSEVFVSTSGNVYRKMGCRDRLQCVTPAVGKRSGETTLCSECCDGDLCQTRLCGSKDDNTTRGPICFHCSTKHYDQCDTVTTCGRDEVCAISYGQQNCIPAQTCRQVISSLAGQLLVSQDMCFNCCTTDLCNNHCTTGHVTNNHVPPTATSKRPCTDLTVPAICKVATSYVCHNRTKADNAGCLHYCGFC